MSKTKIKKQIIDTHIDIDHPTLDYNPIYKVNYMINGSIDTIYIFNGKKDDTLSETELFNKVFTQEETDKIQKDKIKIKFSEQQIYFDDNIGTIKIKILMELKRDISLDEIYLSCQKIETLNSVSVYQLLTQNKRLELTKVRLDQFISNIVSEENGTALPKLQDKDVYTFDDILEMKLEGKKYIVNKVLGQKFFILENEYPFVCNPYDIKGYDSFFEKNTRKSLSTLNIHLLLSSGNILNNNIYLSLAQDVLEYVAGKDINEDTTLKIYYPFLYNKNIHNLEELNENRSKLIENNKKIINDKTAELFQTINMFYDIYKLRKTNLEYHQRGIKYIKAVIKPNFDIKIPLEVIFKIIHATEINPLIKYNPSSRQENIYRLYTDQISTDGRKIPYLKKGTIFKLIKNIGRGKSVAVFIENQQNNQTLVCEFDESGYITIISEFQIAVSQKEVDVFFQESINPIIQEITNVLEQSGYKLNKFTTLYDEHIEIKQLTYDTQIAIKKSVEIDKIKGCISSVFTNESNIFKKDIHLRFKRVSNFNKVTSQEAFILEKSEQGYRGHEIIDLLVENFPDDLDRKNAEELVRKIANEIQVERGVRKTDIKIKDNPGFKTTITLDQETGIITIRVENINDIHYLSTVPVYLDTLIRLTQDKSSTKYPLKEINKLCSTGMKEDIQLRDIISESEETISENDEIYENLETQVRMPENEKLRNAFSLFFDDYEEEEDDDDETPTKGGVKSDSESEVSSDDSSTPAIKPATKIQNDSESEVSSDNSLSSIEKTVDPKSETEVSSDKSQTEPAVDLSSVEIQDTPSSSTSSEKTETSLEVEEPKIEVEEPKIEEELQEDPQVKQKIQKKIKPKVEQVDSDSEDQHEEDVRNIDGMKLNKPYYFQTLIEKKDPILILKEDTAEYNAYSRTCRSDMRRQPVILTDNQLDKINEEHPGFLKDEDVIKYGSNPKNKFNYICPRYWCLKTNTVIEPNELKEVAGKDGKKELMHPTCGKVLPKGEKAVKPGYYIYEFYGEKEKRYPGFQTDKHPDGYCLPCCFAKYNTEGIIQAKQKCYGEEQKVSKKKDEDEYIKGPDKFPLEQGRWGYLPFQIQKMLQEVNADCQISKTNTNIKPNHPCLLRHGIEVNNKQSFVSCISDAVFFGKRNAENQTTKILSVKEMRERIIKSITIDSFIRYQNGNLVTDFFDINRKVDINKYNNCKLFSKINMDKNEDVVYFSKVVSAYENFVRFLSDDDAVIDHTYLWDIVSMPNKYLFPNGVNLVILQLPNDDITNNVQILCPTNHYSTEFYEARKPTIILMKEDGYYEPIYSYTNENKKIVIAKEFKEYDPNLSKTIRSVLKEIVKPFLNTMCRPFESMPNIYKAKRAILLYDLIQKLDKYEYTVLKMVMNFNNKVIGVLAKEPEPSTNVCFVPCYPSALDESLKKGLDYVFMNDVSLWNTYDKTVTFLNKLERRSKKRKEKADIPCKPAFKIIEDELVVGILTETNQFIQISNPIPEIEIENELPSIKNDNYIVNSKTNPTSIDVPISTETDVDEERVDFIKKIKLETNFYNVFRNTIRILINDYENIKIREKIEKEIYEEYILYSEKLVNINKLLRELVKNKIQFIGDENYYKLINEISTCIVKDANSCNSTPNLCTVTENGKCNLILPEKNLISGKVNEQIYYGRISDELIRYNRIKSFMLQPQTYLSFGNIGYNLKDNEVILIQSLLTQEYFETLTPSVTNKYTTHNSYDETQPITTQMYENTIQSLDPTHHKKNEQSCDKNVKDHITSSIWKKCFPDNFKEIEYSKYAFCTFYFIIDLIERKTGTKLTINAIKNELYDEYKKYLPNYKNKIVDILIIEGKKTLGDQVIADTLLFSSLIYSDNYFLTPIDLWLLVNRYNIPTIFISQTFILQTKYTKHEFVAYGDAGDKFAFILIPGLRSENIPSYKLIQSNEGDVFISLEKMNDDGMDKIREAINQKKSIEEYLEHFVKPLKTNYEKKKPKLIQSDELDKERKNKETKGFKTKQKLIIEETSPVTSEEFILEPSNKKTRKTVALKGNKKTRKNIKKKLIIESSSSDKN
jgi:hypothetical protein